MTTQAITQPSSSYRSPRTALLVVLALVVGGLIGAGIVSRGVERHVRHQPRTCPGGARRRTRADVAPCAGDGGALLATVVFMPIDVSNDVVGRLSAPTRALLASAAEQSAI